jgi:probable addiction module antidote protein
MSDKASIKLGPEPSRREIAEHMNRAFATGDVTTICQAIGEAVRLHNITDIARIAGIERPSVYRAFSAGQSPNFSTVLVVLKAMGFQLKATPLQSKGGRVARAARVE